MIFIKLAEKFHKMIKTVACASKSGLPVESDSQTAEIAWHWIVKYLILITKFGSLENSNNFKYERKPHILP